MNKEPEESKRNDSEIGDETESVASEAGASSEDVSEADPKVMDVMDLKVVAAARIAYINADIREYLSTNEKRRQEYIREAAVYSKISSDTRVDVKEMKSVIFSLIALHEKLCKETKNERPQLEPMENEVIKDFKERDIDTEADLLMKEIDKKADEDLARDQAEEKIRIEEEQKNDRQYLEEKRQKTGIAIYTKIGKVNSDVLRRDIIRAEGLLTELRAWKEGKKNLGVDEEKKYEAMIANLEKHIVNDKKMIAERQSTDPLLVEVKGIISDLKDHYKVSVMGYLSRFEAFTNTVNENPKMNSSSLESFRKDLEMVRADRQKKLLEDVKEMTSELKDNFDLNVDDYNSRLEEIAQLANQNNNKDFVDRIEALREELKEEMKGQQESLREEVSAVVGKIADEDIKISQEEAMRAFESLGKAVDEHERTKQAVQKEGSAGENDRKLDLTIIQPQVAKQEKSDQNVDEFIIQDRSVTIEEDLKDKEESAHKLFGKTITARSASTLINDVKLLMADIKESLRKFSSGLSVQMKSRYEKIEKNLESLIKSAEKRVSDVQLSENEMAKTPSGLNEYQVALRGLVAAATNFHVLQKQMRVQENREVLHNNIELITKQPEYQTWLKSDPANRKNDTHQEKAFRAIEKLDVLLKRSDEAMKSEKAPQVWKRYCKGEVRRQLEKMGKEPLKSALTNLANPVAEKTFDQPQKK